MACKARVLTQARAPQDGYTPLFIAAGKGHLEVVKLLLEAGVDKDAPIKVREGELEGVLGAHTVHMFRSGGRSQAAGCQRADEEWVIVQYSVVGNRTRTWERASFWSRSTIPYESSLVKRRRPIGPPRQSVVNR